MSLRQAAQQALEALADSRRSHHYCEDTWYSCPKHEGGCANEAEGDECNCGADKANEKIDQAITAIEQALAEPEQKPVAWYCNQGLKRGVSLKQESPEWMPLYTALRAALAEPEQEPVAFCNGMPAYEGALSKAQRTNLTQDLDAPLTLNGVALYPRRKPLTDEEIERACVPLGAAMLSFTEVARAIERAHGIGEQHE